MPSPCSFFSSTRSTKKPAILDKDPEELSDMEREKRGVIKNAWDQACYQLVTRLARKLPEDWKNQNPGSTSEGKPEKLWALAKARYRANSAGSVYQAAKDVFGMEPFHGTVGQMRHCNIGRIL